MTAGLFITGTDTGVGKTCIAAALVHVLRRRGVAVCGLKPLASGATRGVDGLRNEDALALGRESSRALPYDVVNPYCFEPAIAPHLAAIDAGVQVTAEALVSWYTQAVEGFDVAIVEGAGGWRLPLYPAGFLSDFVEAVRLPVLLVVGLRLGCLNHARLTLEAIERAGRSRFAGWVGNAIDSDFELPERNIDSLTRLLGCGPLATVGFMVDPAVAEVARRLELSDVPAALAMPL